MANVAAPNPLLQSDPQLLADCRIDHYRGSGPGGQKRNKTSSAVRLTHVPTGVVAVATESRSAIENRLWALRRLRIKLACDRRTPVDLLCFEPPTWFLALRRKSRLELSHRHPLYAAAAALLLDLLQALGGNPAAVAINLGLSTTAVIRFLEIEPAYWAAANAIRKRQDQPGLMHRH